MARFVADLLQSDDLAGLTDFDPDRRGPSVGETVRANSRKGRGLEREVWSGRRIRTRDQELKGMPTSIVSVVSRLRTWVKRGLSGIKAPLTVLSAKMELSASILPLILMLTVHWDGVGRDRMPWPDSYPACIGSGRGELRPVTGVTSAWRRSHIGRRTEARRGALRASARRLRARGRKECSGRGCW